MLTLYFPINGTSLGASAFHLLRNIDEEFNLFTLGGGTDIGSFMPVDKALQDRLFAATMRGMREHRVEGMSLKLWHPFQAYERVTAHQALYTFHELDGLTDVERNQLNQQAKVYVPCKFNKDVFRNNGVNVPIEIVPLGVDPSVFRPLEKYANKSGPYVFGMAGKYEARKMHMEILHAFGATFANNPAVKMRCCISNRFIDMQSVYKAIATRIFGGKMPSNIEFVDWLPTETHFADFLGSLDCLVSPSRGESFNLPLLQAMACGAQAITNPDHAHADYADSNNAILVKSSGKSPAFDGTFFKNDGVVNTGDWFNITGESVAQSMLEAFKRGRSVNQAGIETAKKYSWKESANRLISDFKTL